MKEKNITKRKGKCVQDQEHFSDCEITRLWNSLPKKMDKVLNNIKKGTMMHQQGDKLGDLKGIFFI